MSYPNTLAYLYSQLPMFHRIGQAAYKADLNNIIALCNSLNNPQKTFPSIHIAGTNGKGSTSHLLASVFQECGYKTGLFTSPHLKDFRERIRVNGKKIPEKEVVSFVEKMSGDFQSLHPSFFEMTTAFAFDYFAKMKVDIAVMETGMGGRLDSTNIITPVVSVITNIGLDHTQFLGNTLEKIAIEKAGIIKPGIPVVIGETQNETKQVFIETAGEKKSPVFFADQLIKDNPYPTSLKGNYQRKNTKTVLQAISVLKNSGFEISEENIRNGFLNVIDNTGLMGRWQTLSHSPLTICDVGHNKDGIKEVVSQIMKMPYKTLHFVLGSVSDKDHDEILILLPKEAIYYFCKPDIPRGFDAAELKSKAEKFNLEGEVYFSVKKAFIAAQENAGKEDLIFIGGSTFVVAEAV